MDSKLTPKPHRCAAAPGTRPPEPPEESDRIRFKGLQAGERRRLSALPAAICEVDFTVNRLTHVNDIACEYTGYSRDELLQLSISDLLDESCWQRFERRRACIMAGRPVTEPVEYKLRRKDGSALWILLCSTVITENVPPCRARGVFHDITPRKQAEAALRLDRYQLECQVRARTAELVAANRKLKAEIAERRQAEKALRESELKYRTLFDHSSDGIAVFKVIPNNLLRKLIDCNTSYARMSGRSKAELLSLPDMSRLQINRYGHSGGLWEVQHEIERGRSYGGTYSWIRPDGSENHVEYRALPVKLGGHIHVYSIDRDVTARRQADERLRCLSGRLLGAQERERTRISQELHDELGQDLVMLKQRLRRLIVAGADPSARDNTTGELSRCIDGIIDDVRRISRELSPSILRHLGLTAAIRWLAENFSDLYGVATGIELIDVDTMLAEEAQINLYRIIQEAFSNIGKHARASRVSLGIERQNYGLLIRMGDDGIGFNAERVLKKAVVERGLGLETMQERAHMLGGDLRIRSGSDGTTLILRVPVTRGAFHGNLSHCSRR